MKNQEAEKQKESFVRRVATKWSALEVLRGLTPGWLWVCPLSGVEGDEVEDRRTEAERPVTRCG